jgi:hypothetical protein
MPSKKSTASATAAVPRRSGRTKKPTPLKERFDAANNKLPAKELKSKSTKGACKKRAAPESEAAPPKKRTSRASKYKEKNDLTSISSDQSRLKEPTDLVTSISTNTVTINYEEYIEYIYEIEGELAFRMPPNEFFAGEDLQAIFAAYRARYPKSTEEIASCLGNSRMLPTSPNQPDKPERSVKPVKAGEPKTTLTVKDSGLLGLEEEISRVADVPMHMDVPTPDVLFPNASVVMRPPGEGMFNIRDTLEVHANQALDRDRIYVGHYQYYALRKPFRLTCTR